MRALPAVLSHSDVHLLVETKLGSKYASARDLISMRQPTRTNSIASQEFKVIASACFLSPFNPHIRSQMRSNTRFCTTVDLPSQCP